MKVELIYFVVLCIGSVASLDSNLESRFDKVYSKRQWAHGNKHTPGSGSGSTWKATIRVRKGLLALIEKYDIKSVLDAPCGDLTWMRHLLPTFSELNVTYTGIDIVSSVIRVNKRYESSFVNFQHIDLTSSELPKADLVFSRQAMQHLNSEDNIKFLSKLNPRWHAYFMATTYDTVENQNFVRVSGPDNVLINLREPPYNLPTPLERVLEQARVQVYVSLWNVSDIRLSNYELPRG